MAVDYTTLVGSKSTAGSIKFWVNHGGIDAAGILTKAQAWIYERLRSREMRLSTTVNLAEGDYYASLPTGFIEPVSLQLRGDADKLDYVHENLLGRFIDQGDTTPPSGRPMRYAIWNEKFQFEVAADEALVGDLVYYGTPTALGASNTSNFLCTRFPALLQAVCEMFGYRERKRMVEAKDAERQALDDVFEANASEDRNRRGQLLR